MSSIMATQSDAMTSTTPISDCVWLNATVRRSCACSRIRVINMRKSDVVIGAGSGPKRASQQLPCPALPCPALPRPAVHAHAPNLGLPEAARQRQAEASALVAAVEAALDVPLTRRQ
jgi:hypothetical protein